VIQKFREIAGSAKSKSCQLWNVFSASMVHCAGKAKQLCPRMKLDQWISLLTAVGTIGLALITFFLLLDGRKATESQLKIMQGQLDQMDRPWIKIDVGTSNTPLTFIHETGSMQTNVNMTLENVGHSVATNIRHKCKAIPFPYGQHENSFLIEKRKEVCDSIDITDPVADTLFPSEKLLYGNNINVSVNTMRDNSGEISLTADSLIIGCVIYQSSSSSKLHHTNFIYMLAPLAKVEGKDIPVEKLKILPFFNPVDAD